MTHEERFIHDQLAEHESIRAWRAGFTVGILFGGAIGLACLAFSLFIRVGP